MNRGKLKVCSSCKIEKPLTEFIIWAILDHLDQHEQPTEHTLATDPKIMAIAHWGELGYAGIQQRVKECLSARDHPKRKMREKERLYIKLVGRWKAGLGSVGTTEELKRYLEKFKLQTSQLTRRLEPEKVLASIKKLNLKLEFKELWQRSNNTYVWYELLCGKRPREYRII